MMVVVLLLLLLGLRRTTPETQEGPEALHMDKLEPQGGDGRRTRIGGWRSSHLHSPAAGEDRGCLLLIAVAVVVVVALTSENHLATDQRVDKGKVFSSQTKGYQAKQKLTSIIMLVIRPLLLVVLCCLLPWNIAPFINR